MSVRLILEKTHLSIMFALVVAATSVTAWSIYHLADGLAANKSAAACVAKELRISPAPQDPLLKLKRYSTAGDACGAIIVLTTDEVFSTHNSLPGDNDAIKIAAAVYGVAPWMAVVLYWLSSKWLRWIFKPNAA